MLNSQKNSKENWTIYKKLFILEFCFWTIISISLINISIPVMGIIVRELYILCFNNLGMLACIITSGFICFYICLLLWFIQFILTISFVLSFLTKNQFLKKLQ
jgi:hypothetical protein